jgi:hypothetical protein
MTARLRYELDASEHMTELVRESLHLHPRPVSRARSTGTP